MVKVMATHLTSSSEFASLVSQLQLAPDNIHLKKQVIKHLPQMRELAKTNPLALYHLAMIYHPKSDQYRQTVLQAADLGCTNAMLMACQILNKTGLPEDKEMAAHYLQKIEESQDTFIIENSKKLLDNPQQTKETQNPPIKTHAGNHAQSFFTSQPEKKEMGVGLGETAREQPTSSHL
ncbi:hypothetical protein LDG_6773 [Legionella drancourtii LLAP12]|uniref:Dot/Icm secretion system substrate n=2 Tax=Legionella drancourtii TaxID=168933 RepID=G9ENF0_9GAMM|nr:hypothetical protein LDG_6773 [Legionella drancourtii LLAP12]